MKPFALILICVLFSPTSRADESSASEPPQMQRTRASLITSLRGNYVFAGSDATSISNMGLLSGKAYGSAGVSHAFRPYGVEFEHRHELSGALYLGPSVRLVPTGVRLSLGSPEQSGWDGMATLVLGAAPEVHPGQRLGFEFGLRLRRWQLSKGAFPSTGHAGFVVAAHIQSHAWEGLFEAGLMAAGLGNPTSLGKQRDSSTLRARVGRNFSVGSTIIVPWLEFFHTHRDFYGATILPGETSVFVDEATLNLGLSVEI